MVDKKDLSLIPTAKDYYKCPNCGEVAPDEGYYIIDDQMYPEIYNESKGYNNNGDYWNWDEVHICPKCKTKFKIKNGAY